MNQRNQLRDAHHLTTHSFFSGAIFITNDTKAFGRSGSTLRAQLEALCSTKIMSAGEFSAFCEARRAARDRRRYGAT